MLPSQWVAAIPDDAELARRQGVSVEAVQLTRSAEVIDLHIEGYLVPRLMPYDPRERHDRWPFGGRWFGHLDFPRILEGGLTGAMWSITTNPARGPAGRWAAFLDNLARLRASIEATDGLFRVVRDAREYRAARAEGAHACLLAIQGGNALEAAPDGPASIPDDVITRVTLVHLTSSCYGVTSSPLRLGGGDRGLSPAGRDLVAALDARRVLVDLAHINPAGFWDAVAVHDRSLPLIATHTGVSGVKPHWRNLDDRQLRAIADSGGTVGIIYSQAFLAVRGGPRDVGMIVDHMQHVVDTVGEDFASIGSDYDGAIVPPPDLRCGSHYPRLVQHMLDRGWSTERIRKVLGGNALRVLSEIRPG